MSLVLDLDLGDPFFLDAVFFFFLYGVGGGTLLRLATRADDRWGTDGLRLKVVVTSSDCRVTHTSSSDRDLGFMK